jgi:two-component system sensor histidine kinase AlgZ
MQKNDPVAKDPKAVADGLTSGGAYYIGQLFGWGIYAFIQYLLSPSPRGVKSVALVGTWCAIGMLCTHVLKVYVNRRRWQTIPELVVPFAIAALLIPVAMNAALIAVSVLVLNDRFEVTHVGIALAHYFQNVLGLLVWCAIFLIASEARRRRVAEMEALQLALAAQTSQFRALRSQLNPHFLFNCLNSLRELIDEDRDRAKQVVDRLSELLRYTLRAGRIETVSLRDELHAVEDYLSLEKVRFEERLRFTFDIDPQSLEAKLPPMLLQTLAENAVKHGIARLPAGGDLSIVTHLLETKLLVEVINTGSLSPTAKNSSSVGLENASERLRLMYGDGASLTLTAVEEGRVRAAAVIPIHSTNGAG